MHRIADDLVTAVAVVSLVVFGLRSAADPTLVVGAISGLGGYRLRQAGRRE